MINVAINGLGRIGRAALKIVMETPELNLVAANDIGSSESIEYLLRYDTVYGRYEKPVDAADEGYLTIGEHRLRLLHERDPGRLPWTALGADIVFECTGAFTKQEDLEAHIRAGAGHVILSAPSRADGVETVVHGVNTPQVNSTVFSCASCTTNCITPVMEILGRRIGVKKATMTAVHAYTASQAIVDSAQRRLRRGRAAGANLVPTSTGAAMATARALPEYRGKFDGVAVRAPITVGSLAEIVALVHRTTTVDEVNQVFTEEATGQRYRGILGVTSDPIVSSDIIKDPRASIVDLGMTQVVDGDLVKVMSWYDNEWGYANQLVREAVRIAGASDHQHAGRPA
jgi:glyceraldehyde 3-phosphate dehydrogenase